MAPSSGSGARRDSLVRGFLIALLVSLALSTIVGLLGTAIDLGEDGGRLLASLAIVTAFIAFGLAAVALLDRGAGPFLAIPSLLASAIGLGLSVWALWTEPSSATFFRTWGTVLLCAVVFAFACLVLLIRRTHAVVLILVGVSLASLAVGWVVGLGAIWQVISVAEGLARFLTALGIVTVFGALASPILNGVLRR